MYLIPSIVLVSDECAEMNIDYEGNDAQSASNVKSWRACADLCAKREGCFAWTWLSNEYKGKGSIKLKCHFKNKYWRRGRKDLVGAISGSAICAGWCFGIHQP